MHQAQKPYLKRKNIDKYLDRLSELLVINKLGEHSILIVGGAAIALTGGFLSRATVDIDICLREQNKLYDCCLQVASEKNLPEDWINADVMHSDSYSSKLFDKAKLHKVYNRVLKVYVASDIDLLCMKLVSFRPKDAPDLDNLIKKIKKQNYTLNDVMQNFEYLYGSLYLLKEKQRKYLISNLRG